MTSAVSLAGGVALGLASSLHCIGMCGGISVLFGGSGCGGKPSGGAGASREQALLHGGRIASYAMLGALAGGLGSAAVAGMTGGQGLAATGGHALLRWAAALSLGWIGLATAGLAPAPAALAHVGPGRPAMRAMLRLPVAARRLAGGLLWGLMPCGMVYGALLFALFAGTATGGALVMLGFGLGTLPALLATRLGYGRLRALLRGPGMEKALGGALVLIALASLVDQPAVLGAYCAHLLRMG